MFNFERNIYNIQQIYFSFIPNEIMSFYIIQLYINSPKGLIVRQLWKPNRIKKTYQ